MLPKKGEHAMKKKRSAAYASNTSLERIRLDEDDNVQNPSLEAIKQSKREADMNEK